MFVRAGVAYSPMKAVVLLTHDEAPVDTHKCCSCEQYPNEADNAYWFCKTFSCQAFAFFCFVFFSPIESVEMN